MPIWHPVFKFYPHPNNLKINVVIEHTMIATPVGINAARRVHLILAVSFFIVNRLVAQGQCSRQNSIVLRA